LKITADIDLQQLVELLNERFNTIETKVDAIAQKVNEPKEEMLTINQVAEFFKVSRGTVNNWIDAGKLNVEHLNGTIPRVSNWEIERFRKAKFELELKRGQKRLYQNMEN
jgi:excisionase family DNA binding protein